MPITHKKHLANYGYKPDRQESGKFDPKLTERVFQRLVEQYGEDNVWDARILEQVFDTSTAHYTYEIYWDVVRIDTEETGSLLQTGRLTHAPRFYYGFSVRRDS